MPRLFTQTVVLTLVCLSSQILDANLGEDAAAPMTVASSSSALIGFATLEERDTRLPENGPPCKVLELPLELPVASPAKRGRGRGAKVPHHTRRPVITLFLEKSLVPLGDRVSTPYASPSATASVVATAAAQHGVASLKVEEQQTLSSSPEPPDIAMKTEGKAPGSEPRTTRESMQLKVIQAWGLVAGAKALDTVVTVRACGRNLGTTRVSAVGGTTSPEWIDEQ